MPLVKIASGDSLVITEPNILIIMQT